MTRFTKPVREGKRRAKAVAKQVDGYAYTFVVVDGRKFEVRCYPGLRPAKITRVEKV